jgi:hypothetical protein
MLYQTPREKHVQYLAVFGVCSADSSHDEASIGLATATAVTTGPSGKPLSMGSLQLYTCLKYNM